MADFIEILSPSALKDIKTANDEVIKLVANIDKAGEKMRNIKTPSGSDNAIKSMQKQAENYEKQINSLQIKLDTASRKQQAVNEKTRLSEIKLQQQREKAFDSYEKQLEKERQSLLKSENIYNRIQTKVNEMIPVYNNLQAKQKLGLTLTAKEEGQLKLLTDRLNKYQNILKDTDTNIGKYTRHVGDYARANNYMSISVGQIARELPNFGQSFQVGVLSLTNNVGALIDSFKQINAQNEILKSQGQQTKSALSSMFTAFFSWQTALFIGIGIFSAYSKEIGAWVSSLWDANSALKATERAMVDAYEAKTRYNFATAEGMKNTRKEFDDFIMLLDITKSTTKSYDERLNAAKRLQEKYPGYLKTFSQEQILAFQSGKANEKLSSTIKQLTQDIYKRNLAQAQASEASKTFSELADLREEFKYREAINKQINSEDYNTRETYKKRAKERAEMVNDSEDFVKKFGEVTITDLGQYSEIEINSLKIRYNALLKEFNKERKAINEKYLETSLLDYDPDKQKANAKQKREKIHLNFAEVESLYALKLAELELQKIRIANRVNDEKAQLDDRLKARKEFSEKSIEILNLETDKEKAILFEKYNDDLAKNNLAYKNKDITAQEWTKNLVDINNRFNNEKAKSDVVYSQKWEALIKEDADFYRKIEEQKAGYAKSTLDRIFKYQQEQQKKTSENERLILSKREEAYQKYIQLQKDENDIAKQRELNQAVDALQVQDIIDKYDKLNKSLDELSKKDSPLTKQKEATDAWIDSLSSGYINKALDDIGISSLKMFLDFDKAGQSTYDKLIEGADAAEKFAINFQAIGDVAQDVFNKIFELSNKRFEVQKENLQKEYEINKAFAGDSASARAEVEAQYQAKQKELKKREFKAHKQQALFNIAIDTAQAIIATLAHTPPPIGTPFAIAMGALGAIQAGVVASQQIPQYWKGTDNANEGFAWTQEKGRELILDKNNKIKSTGSDKGAQLTYLNKGDKVKTASETMDMLMFNSGLNNILTNNGIMMPKVEVNAPSIDLSPVIDAIKNKESVNLNIDKGGLDIYVTNGHERKLNQNARKNFSGKIIA